MSNIDNAYSETVGNMTRLTAKLLDGTENEVVSPVSVYRILSMLSEITAGNTKEQIDKVIGGNRLSAKKLNRILDVNDGNTFCSISESVWANLFFDIRKEKLEELKKDFGCEIFTVTLGNNETDEQIRGWVNRKTKGLLQKETQSIKTNVYDTAVLLSSIYLKCAWADKFEKDSNMIGWFTDEDENKTRSEYMCSTRYGNVIYGSGFMAVRKSMGEYFDMWLILPEKDVKLKDLVRGSEIYDLIKDGRNFRSKECLLSMRLPKFDVAVHKGLTDTLLSLGITDVFDYRIADFSPFVNGDRFYISQADQAARLKVDENGLEAAAWTRAHVYFGMGVYDRKKTEKVEFYLDRPFAFLVADEGLPVFAGTVTKPLETDKE